MSLVVKSLKEVCYESSSEGDRKLKNTIFFCKFFYLLLRRNREYSWVKHENESYCYISNVLLNIQIFTSIGVEHRDKIGRGDRFIIIWDLRYVNQLQD